jgi:hypothetical protein
MAPKDECTKAHKRLMKTPNSIPEIVLNITFAVKYTTTKRAK